MNIKLRYFPRLAALLVICALTLFAPVEAARANSGSRPIGTIFGWGTYTVDQLPVPAGTLLFTGDVVATHDGSGAELNLVSGAVARIEPASEVRLAAPEGTLDLRQGGLTLRSSGKPAHASLLGTSVVVGTNSPAICRLEVRATSALVTSDQGTVTVDGSPSASVLAPGQFAKLQRTPRQAATLPRPHAGPAKLTAISARLGQAPSGSPSVVLPEDLHAAGRVVGTYPDVEVRHPDSPIAVPLRLGELVDVGDVLGTMTGGRARIQLLDNTLFDLGMSSTVSVLRHDPARHATEIELHEGRLHANIGAPEGSEARFDVRTPIVRVSANPTTLLVSAQPKEAVVCSAGSGPVVIQNSKGKAPVTLTAGQCSVTRAGEAPGPPHSDPARLEREMELATFESGPGTPELARARALMEAATSANAGAAVLNGVLLIVVYNVKEVNFTAPTPTFSDLPNQAAAAAEAARALCLAFNNSFGRIASPSMPVSQCPGPGP